MANEILTPVQFAERLQIGRSTLFDWLRKGVLVSGVHFFKRGRIIRFLWSDAVVASLMEATRQPDAPKRPQLRQKSQSSQPGINWEY
jgi:hypothetical protein